MNHTAEKYQSAERRIEWLADELDQLIEEQRPEERAELRLFASALISEKLSASASTSVEGEIIQTRPPMGIIAGSILLLIIGAGLFVVLAPIGMVLMALAVIGLGWGAISHFVKR